jgi:hypothetical protein
MVRRAIALIGWGGAGVVLSLGLVTGAFRIAGTRLSDPASPIRVSMPSLISPTPSPESASSSTRSAHTGASSVTSTPEPVRSSDGSGDAGPGGPSHAAEPAEHAGDD